MISQYLLISLKTVQTSQSAYACCQKATADNSSCCQKANTAGYYGIHFRYCTENSQNQTSQSHSTGQDSSCNRHEQPLHTDTCHFLIKSRHFLFPICLRSGSILCRTLLLSLFLKSLCSGLLLFFLYPGVGISISKHIIQAIFNGCTSSLYCCIHCQIYCIIYCIFYFFCHFLIVLGVYAVINDGFKSVP